MCKIMLDLVIPIFLYKYVSIQGGPSLYWSISIHFHLSEELLFVFRYHVLFGWDPQFSKGVIKLFHILLSILFSIHIILFTHYDISFYFCKFAENLPIQIQ